MKFNYILDEYPNNLEINGKTYAIRSDFKIILKLIKLLSDKAFTPYEKEKIALKLFYIEDVKGDEFIKTIFDFITCFKKTKRRTKSLDFNKDNQYIFSGFLKEFQIDLTKINLHWFKFLALFEELKDCKIVEIIDIRERKITPSMSKEEKEQLTKLKRIYSLEENKNDYFYKMLERSENG